MPYFFVMEGKIYDFPTKKPKAQVQVLTKAIIWLSGHGFQHLDIWLSGPGFQDLDRCTDIGHRKFSILRSSHLFPVTFLCVQWSQTHARTHRLACVMNQSRGHWLLSDALTTITLTMNMEVKLLLLVGLKSLTHMKLRVSSCK